jgi:putative heme-binding domain-containing protein
LAFGSLPFGSRLTVAFVALLTSNSASAQRDLTAIPKPDTERERKEFKLHPELEINLFASDPDIAKPIQMNWDSRGRLWVASSEVYPQIKPGQQPTDKIVILEDSNGDGRSDKRIVFADGLLIPTGVLPHENGAYVANSTEILHMQDANGDGVADKKTVLLTGFGTEDTHHIIHTFRWGMDGRFYFNQSIYIHSHVETPWGPRELLAGGIWQYRPQTARLEVFAKGFVNSWGHVFDRWGQSLATDGAYGEGINHVFPGAAFVTAHDSPRLLKGLSPGQPKHCGLEIISGDHFPPEWQGSFVTNDFRGNRINRFALTPSGSSFTARQLPDVLSSPNIAFRPIDARMGPDGALYIADWYNPIIQHGEVDFRDPRRDHAHGRIWRITAKGRPLMKPKRLDQADIPTLLDTLKSNLELERTQAKLELRRRPKDQVLPLLEKWWRGIKHNDPNVDHRLLEALWTYQTLDVFDRDYLGLVATVNEPMARAAALRVAQEWQDRDNHATMKKSFIIDPSPFVRLEVINIIRTLNEANAIDVAMIALDKEVDANIDYALWLLCRQKQSDWLPRLQKGEKLFGGDFKKLLFALRAVESPASAPPLVAMLKAGQVPADQRAAVLELVAKLGGQAEIDELWAMAKKAEGADRSSLIRALLATAQERKLKPSRDTNLIVPLVKMEKDLDALRLAGYWQEREALQSLLDFAQSPKFSSKAVRIAAVQALVHYQMPVVKAHLSDFAEFGPADSHPSIRAAAIAAQVSTRPNDAAAWAAKLLASPTDPEFEESDLKAMFDAFLQRKGGIDALNVALANKKLPPDRAALALRIVNASGRDVGKLAATLNRMVGSTGMPTAFSSAERATLLSDVQSQGDAARGEAVYRREALQCLKCHAIGGAGGLVGPDMVSLGSSAQIDYIVESLLEPSKKIKEGYHSTTVLKTDGASLVGVVVSKTDRELKLRDANGAEIFIATADIEAAKPSAVSLMPVDLYKGLPRSDFLDLAKFLSQLGKDGPYKVGPEKIVRRYRALTATNEARGLLMRVGNQALFEGKPGLTWKPAYSMVSGELPMSDLQSLPHFNGEFFAAVRFEIESPTAGKIGLKWNDPQNVKLWLGSEEYPVTKEMSLPAGKGVNVVTLLIDKKRRQTPLKIEVIDDKGSRPVSGQ